MLLAAETGADVIVVELFAMFHDSKRTNEYDDPGHGARAAEFARELRGVRFELDDLRFDQLLEACTFHTERRHSSDATIATCWDADRLDLGRVGIIPREDYLNTTSAKRMARELQTRFQRRIIER
jgi:uncharacterized protein